VLNDGARNGNAHVHLWIGNGSFASRRNSNDARLRFYPMLT
jgi:hypothetical protein